VVQVERVALVQLHMLQVLLETTQTLSRILMRVGQFWRQHQRVQMVALLVLVEVMQQEVHQVLEQQVQTVEQVEQVQLHTQEV
jgi:hypothetical protein